MDPCGSLPVTGFDSASWVLLGGAAVLSGAALVFSKRGATEHGRASLRVIALVVLAAGAVLLVAQRAGAQEDCTSPAQEQQTTTSAPTTSTTGGTSNSTVRQTYPLSPG